MFLLYEKLRSFGFAIRIFSEKRGFKIPGLVKGRDGISRPAEVRSTNKFQFTVRFKWDMLLLKFGFHE